MADGLCIPKSCPDQVPNGALSEPCSAKVGSRCGYTCDSGYSKVYRTRIVCETSTNWSRNPHSLCQHNSLQQCPYEVPNGDLDLSCNRLPGDTCTFSCREGYMAPKQTTVTCDSMLHWSQSLQSACKEILCPITIPNGHITLSCSRRYGSYCYNDGYGCDPEYVKPSTPPRLYCNASGQWQWYTTQGEPCFREEDMCPSHIRNGDIVWHCDRQAGSHCTYSCDPGCTQNRSTVWLNCEADGRWNEDTERLCTDCRPVSTTRVSTTVTTTMTNLCPAIIRRGRIDSSCDRKLHSTCYITCETGCLNKASILHCNTGFVWDYASYACDCSEANTSSPPGIASSGVIVEVCGGVVLMIIIFTVCIVIDRKRKRQSTSVPTPCAVSQRSEYRTNIPGRPSVGGMPLGLTSPTYGRTSLNYGIMSPNNANPSNETNNSSLQTQQNYQGNIYAWLQPPLDNDNFDTESPAYSSIATVVEPAENPPTYAEDPPSYEQATSYTVEFKV